MSNVVPPETIVKLHKGTITLEYAKKFTWLNIKGYIYPVNEAVGLSPRFMTMLLHRVNAKRATNVVITGEAGIGKSYFAMQLARCVEGLDKNHKDNFTLDQVVFTFKEFMDLVTDLPMGKAIVFDEPSYAMGKREWYKELNKALVATIESMRFKVHPLFIPIINKSLLDKTVRDHLIQYMVVCKKLGQGVAYRVQASQFEEKTYYSEICKLHYPLMDIYRCAKPSCLGCKKLDTCRIFRAQYERKKASIQDKRYEEARDMAEELETKRLTMLQIEKLSLTVKDKWLTDKGIDIQRLRVALADEYGVKIGNNRGYQLKAMLEMHHPEILNHDG